MESQVYSNRTDEAFEQQNGIGNNEQDLKPGNHTETEQTHIGNGVIANERKGSVKTEINSKIYESMEMEGPAQQRIRSKSIYHKYEDNVSNSHKSMIANLVSSLLILILWGLFIAPSGVLLWGLIDFYINPIDPLSNETVAMVYNEDRCEANATLQNLTAEITRVAQGRYNTTNFSCISNFVSNGSQCVPECLAQYEGGDVYYYLSFVTVPIFSFLTLLAAAVGASTWLCLKSLWKFPHIISLYLTICVFGQALMIFAGSLYRQKFYCSSSNLYISQANPTIQCQIQGPLFHYFLLAFMLWYICDIFNIVYVILYPMKAATFFRHSLKIHILQSFISWGVPLLIIGIVLAVTFKYKIYSFPIVCLPGEFPLLFTFYIPGVVFSLFSGTGIILFGLTLYKRHYKVAQTSTNNIYRSLLIHLIVYTVALSTQIFIIVLEFTYASYKQKLTEALETTFNYCITALYTSPNCCEMTYLRYSAPFLEFLYETAACIWGIVALSVVSVKEAKTMWIKILTCAKCRHVYQEHLTRTTAAPTNN